MVENLKNDRKIIVYSDMILCFIYLGFLTGKTPIIYEPLHGISNNVVCASSKASDQPVHTSSLIRAFAIRLNII